MDKTQFIEAIAQAAIKYAPQYGICVVSPVVAQACLESAYGTSNKAKRNNFFGLKYRKGRVSCHSGYFRDGSQEQKADGTYYPVQDDWYVFANLEDGVQGYFQFINIDRYANLKGVTDAHKYLELIKGDGYATSLYYVDNVWSVVQKYGLTKYDEQLKGGISMGYTNSPLVDCKVMSPNHSGTRTHTIDRITPHCVVGQLKAENIGYCFDDTNHQASCNYGIGTEGRVCSIVDEKNRSWCTSSSANDQRAITIECASDSKEPYAFNDKVYSKLIDLCVDICKRNGKTKLLWFGDKDKTLNYKPASDEMVLTVHRWFANKSCPGSWMYARMGDLASKVTARLGGTTEKKEETKEEGKVVYRVQIGAYSKKENAEAMVKKLKAAGFNAIIKTEGEVTGTVKEEVVEPVSDVPYKVQVSITDLNIRKGPGTNYKTNGVCPKGVFTVVEESDGKGATKWGKLKSGAGWISLDYAKKI